MDWERISINLLPSELEEFEKARDGRKSRDFIMRLINGDNNEAMEAINQVVQDLTKQITLFHNIMRKIIPSMLKARVSIKFSENELEEVAKYK